MVKIGIIGASGYTGGELMRLLISHPEAKLELVTSRSNVGVKVGELFPGLNKLVDLRFEDVDVDEIGKRCDLVFTAVPHGTSMKVVPDLLNAGLKVIDLGADYRLKDPVEYKAWYHLEHEDVSNLTKYAVYGLPELYRNEIKDTPLVANPGCYPTSVLLGVVPLLKRNLADARGMIVDSKSGVSGAGRKEKPDLHFPELHGNFKAYSFPGHRHTSEMEGVISQITGEHFRITFTPHLLPIARGILSTIYLPLKDGVGVEEINAAYDEDYSHEPFVRFLKDSTPQTKNVFGSNFCDIAVKIDTRTNRVIVVSAIDNLVKGASGQAIQNMNIMYGFEETLGLRFAGITP